MAELFNQIEPLQMPGDDGECACVSSDRRWMWIDCRPFSVDAVRALIAWATEAMPVDADRCKHSIRFPHECLNCIHAESTSGPTP